MIHQAIVKKKGGHEDESKYSGRYGSLASIEGKPYSSITAVTAKNGTAIVTCLGEIYARIPNRFQLQAESSDRISRMLPQLSPVVP